jgi:hypothetical protein
MNSHWIRFFLRVSSISLPNHNSTIVPYSSHPPRCAIGLTRQHIITSSVSTLGASSQSWYCAGHRVTELSFRFHLIVLMLRIRKWNLNDLRDTVLRNVTPCSPVEVYPTFRRNILPPSSVLKSKSHKQEDDCACCLTYLNFYRTARRQIPEDSTRHNHSCENLKSNI